MKKILIMCSQAPCSSVSSEDFLDTALTLAAMSLNVDLLFSGEGMKQLSPKHNQHTKEKLATLPMYGVSKIYTTEDSHLGNQQLFNTEAVAPTDLSSIFSQYDHVIHT